LSPAVAARVVVVPSWFIRALIAEFLDPPPPFRVIEIAGRASGQ
jgi:hypothetical protein